MGLIWFILGVFLLSLGVIIGESFEYFNNLYFFRSGCAEWLITWGWGLDQLGQMEEWDRSFA